MISAMLRPFTAMWQALVRYHQRHLDGDPDVEQLKQQQHEAMQSNQRLNVIEQKYLGGIRHGRNT